MGNTSLIRSRWAAIGAAVAITLGAGGLNIALAGSFTPSTSVDPDQLYFVPITPCRLLDTRTASQVGARSTPFGAGAFQSFRARGDRGNCVGIPQNSQALSLNVTATSPSANTFLTIWPSDATMPLSSNLNPNAGKTIANAVTVALSDLLGQFDIYNSSGTVQVIVDVVGYYTPLAHNNLSAVVTYDGVLFRDVGALSASTSATGIYNVTFDRDISDCTLVAGLGGYSTTPEGAGSVSTAFVMGNEDTVLVHTFDPLASLTNSSFHLIVLCPEVVVALG